jgi:hypothetical protein
MAEHRFVMSQFVKFDDSKEQAMLCENGDQVN